MTGAPARVVFLGSGGFAVPTLDRLADLADVEVVGVVSAPDRPAGRGGRLAGVPVAQAARHRGLPLLQPDRIRSADAIDTIRALRPDVGVLADYGQIVPQALIDTPPRGILNVHPSLLPRHRGAAPVPATILAGDAETGVTLIEMDAGLDTGAIVAVQRWQLTGEEIASELEARAADAGAGLVAKTIGPWLRGELPAIPQPDAGATLTKPLRREDGRLDPARSAIELERQVRAYKPWPGSFLETVAGRLIVWRAAPENATSGADPGTFGPGPELRLATADGWLRLEEVQPAGGRRMPGAAWILGRPAVPGSTVS